MPDKLSPKWKIAIAAAFALGIFLRLVWLQDMEYFSDQRVAFLASQRPFWNPDQSWVDNGLGVISSVGILSPGLTYWIFQILAKTFAISHPLPLVFATRLTGIAALGLLLFFALKIVEESERETWLWAWLLMLVNPFSVLFQRRMWPPTFLYFLFAVLLIAYWRRERAWGSFLLGLCGILIAQLHMLAGLLYAALLFWAWMNGRLRLRFLPWAAASVIALLPMVPWLVYLYQQIALGHGTGDRVWEVAYQLRFWRFWITQPSGLLLTYTLEPGGYFREFLAFPTIAGRATYLVAAFHALAAGIMMIIVSSAINSGFRTFQAARRTASLQPVALSFWGRARETDQAIQAGFWGFGLAMTAKTFYIYRHYLICSAPLEFAWVTRSALQLPAFWRHRVLLLFFFAQLGISAGLLCYLHQNGGAPGAEYGHTFRRQMEMGIWTSNNNPLFHRDVYKPLPPAEPIPFEKIPTDYR